MRYADICKLDMSNGIGVGVTLFVSGCSHKCSGCFNPETWSFEKGELFTKETRHKIVELCSRPYIQRLTLSGGDPLENCNLYELACLTQKIKNDLPHIKIWCYTGYTWEELMDKIESRYYVQYLPALLNNIDVLVDGPFIQEKKDITLEFKGSNNQRLINVRESLEQRKVVLWQM